MRYAIRRASADRMAPFLATTCSPRAGRRQSRTIREGGLLGQGAGPEWWRGEFGLVARAAPHNPNDSGTIVFQLASSKMYELSSNHHDASCRLAPLTFLARASKRAHSQALHARAQWSGTGRSRRHYSQVPRSVRLPPAPATIYRCAAVLGAAAHSAQPLGALSIRSNHQSRSLKPLSFHNLNLQTTPFSPWTCHIPKAATYDKFQIPTAIPGSAARTLAHNVGQRPEPLCQNPPHG
jgi:hypothetical protein